MFFIHKCLLWGALVSTVLGCQSIGSTPEEDQTPDSIEHRWQTRDTISLQQGEIPENWSKISLDKGFYIAFPEQPKQRELKEKKQVIYKLEKNNYTLLLTQTDLSQDSSFLKNRRRPEDFYYAIIQDMVADLNTKVEQQYLLTLLKTYTAARADFRTETELISAQFVLIGNTLYTASSCLWKQDKTALLQIRDFFFASFGKELYIN